MGSEITNPAPKMEEEAIINPFPGTQLALSLLNDLNKI